MHKLDWVKNSGIVRDAKQQHGWAIAIAFSAIFLSAAGCSKNETAPARQVQPAQGGDTPSDPAETSSQSTNTQPLVDDETDSGEAILAKNPRSAEELAAERQALDQRVWRQEVLAQKYEQYFISLWDQLRASAAPSSLLSELPCDAIRYGTIENVDALPHAIQQFGFSPPKQQRTKAEWKQLVEQFRSRGFRLVESEWHHSSFSLTDSGAESKISFVLHLIRPLSDSSSGDGEDQQPPTAGELLASTAPQQRIVARGTLRVLWQASNGNEAVATPDMLEVTELNAWARAGQLGFREVLEFRRRENEVASAHPLLVYDLDRDGLPEILLPRWNRLYWNEGKGRFREERIVDARLRVAECGVLADINQDGYVDLVTVDRETNHPVALLWGTDGRFQTPQGALAEIEVPQTLAIAAGDVDGDDDLDLWLTQYKPSYLGGQMPHPYYDANDGDPAYLLINDGTGAFRDGTDEYGLSAKRRRRTYSTSFVDYDEDGDQDLIVVSDYAGVDLYENNGERLIDVTASRLPEEDLFGMAHSIGDFNGDGKLDAYLIGMSSTTARRLDQMGLEDPRYQLREGARTQMGYGNRMVLWNGERFVDAPFKSSVARTGWSWGTSNFDFDLDGDRDIYVANGFRSGRSCQDYCTTFWRHDIYTGAVSQGNDHAGLAELFTGLMGDLNSGATSWNGYEHNALLMNLENKGFVNVGFLLGVGFEYDARCVVTTDLDADGKPDLLVGRYRLIDGGYALDIKGYQNVLPTDGKWVGFHLDGANRHATGAKVTLKTDSDTKVAWVVNGDSFLSQHPATVHFGLGADQEPKSVVVTWANGDRSTISELEPNQYLRIER